MVSTDNPSLNIAQDEELQLSCFYLEDTLLGIDLSIVQEINEELDITQVPCSPEYVLGIMNLRGQIITVIDQARKIGFHPSTRTEESRIIIVQSQKEFIGLLVDRIADVITVKRQDITKAPSNIKGAQGRFFRGVIQTNANELLSLLDVEIVLDNAAAHEIS